QVRADTADLCQALKRQGLGLIAAVGSHQSQREDCRIVLWHATAVADFNDAVHGTNTIRRDAANDRVMVLLHKVAFSDVIGSAFTAEDEETAKPRPASRSPRITSRRVRHLRRTRNWLRLRSSAAVEDLCVVHSHVGLLFCLCVANFLRGLCC